MIFVTMTKKYKIYRIIMLIVMFIGALHDDHWESVSVLFVCRENRNDIVVMLCVQLLYSNICSSNYRV